MLAVARKVILHLLKVLMDKSTKDRLSKTPAGRKYALAIMIFAAATLMCVITPCLSMFVFKAATPLVILSGSEWVTVMSMIGAFYFSANVAQKRLVGPTDPTPVDPPPPEPPVEVLASAPATPEVQAEKK